MVKAAILNNTILSNFSSLSRMDIIKAVFDEHHTSKDVFDEIIRGIERGYSFLHQVKEVLYPISRDGWLIIEGLKDLEDYRLYAEFLRKINPGEASCVVIAHREGWIFVSDDREARKVAESLGLKTSGTLGILKVAIDKKIISVKEGDFLLDLMIKRGYRSPIRRMDELLKKEKKPD